MSSSCASGLAMVLAAFMPLAAADGTSDAPVEVLGRNLSNWLHRGYVVVAGPVGALGAFFTGSTTVSNLTFAMIQRSVARRIHVSASGLIALQTAAAAAGNSVCLSNIIAAKSVVSSPLSEGTFIRVTAPTCALHLAVITLVAAACFLDIS